MTRGRIYLFDRAGICHVSSQYPCDMYMDLPYGHGTSIITAFLRRHSETKILFLELGVGFNTPGIIKIPFIRMCEHNKEYTYACINYDDVYISEAIAKQAICISEDIGKVISDLLIR